MFCGSGRAVGHRVMPTLLLALGLALQTGAASVISSAGSNEPTSPKARRTFAEALEWQQKGDKAIAMDTFRKANEQDGGKCAVCLQKAYALATETSAFKEAAGIIRDWLPLARTDADRAALQFNLGMVLIREGVNEKKDKCFTESCDAFKTSLAEDPALAASHYGMGVALAHLHQDDAARAEFKAFLTEDKDHLAMHPRVGRYIDDVNLARAAMAPPFEVTTLDGQTVSMDSLHGKVVLINFWGYLVRPVPRGAAAHARHRQEVSGTAVRGAQH